MVAKAAQTTEVQKQEPKTAAVVLHDDGLFRDLFDTDRFTQLWRIAQMFAQSQMIPKHFQGHPEDCFITCQMAMRLGVDPFMMLQNTYVTNGKPGIEGKLAIALVNTSGKFDRELEYEFFGKAGTEEYGCFAWTERRGVRVEGPKVTIGTAKKEGWYERNPKWKSIPDLLLMYRSGAWFGRTRCPERLMGMQTKEELEDVFGNAIEVDAEIVEPASGNGKSRKNRSRAEMPPIAMPQAKTTEEIPPAEPYRQAAAPSTHCANMDCEKAFADDACRYASPAGDCCSESCANFMKRLEKEQGEA